MTHAEADQSRNPFRTVVAFTAAGWLTVAAAYELVAPAWGVISPVTWIVTWAGWLCAIAVPATVGVRWLAKRTTPVPRARRPQARALVAVGIVAAAALWLIKPPALTVEGHVNLHRAALDALAADYQAGAIDAPVALPLRWRVLSIDGHAHPRCGSTTAADQQCALYLPLWQSWRGEQGAGIAHYPTRPAPGAALATASGDVGTPIREIADGWWLVG